MIVEEVDKLLASFLDENQNIFLVEKKVSSGNQIEILIDSFENISIKDCILLSRHIEFSLDRDENDFSLQVASAGLSEPFKVFMQYQKYVGSQVDVYLRGGQKVFGKLIDADASKGIKLETKRTEKVGKKKKEVLEELHFTFDQIDKTKLVISF
ncbi:MAG: ribosome assembly cofactor RimP [Flavobacteriales bacterium]|jgi:ribosome maturation factor RimP|tara:strand:+ start:1183 stop:1644 length:462 start_codon:yes stop_codon:yes gene_type:complete